MLGRVDRCDLTAHKSGYDYKAVMRELQGKYGFNKIGEGAFGVILGGENCVIKIIKDISRCPELVKEKEIYEVIEHKRGQMIGIRAKVPKYHIYNEFVDFCHFNTERIYSPLSGYGDPFGDGEAGYGYVVDEDQFSYLMITPDGDRVTKSKDEVYLIDRAGGLVHFYVNHFDKDLRLKLDNYQGILMGRDNLEKYFGTNIVEQFAYSIGQLMSFLMLDCQIIPIDIEIVIGSTSKDNRVAIPYIYDFNEALLAIDFKGTSIYDRMAQAMYSKNGKNYFPNAENPYYRYFYSGFVSRNNYVEEAKYILDKYNSLF